MNSVIFTQVGAKNTVNLKLCLDMNTTTCKHGIATDEYCPSCKISEYMTRQLEVRNIITTYTLSLITAEQAMEQMTKLFWPVDDKEKA